MHTRRKTRNDPDNGTSVTATKLCLEWGPHEPYTKRSLSDPIQHLPGKIPANVSSLTEKARKLTHGIQTITKNTAGDVVNPKTNHPLLQEIVSRRERQYHRREHQPLGQSRSVIEAVLPDFTKQEKFRFGRITELGESVAVIMGQDQTCKDSNEIHRQYVLSHGSFYPGERRNHYEIGWAPPVSKESDLLNRAYSDGNRVKESLYWQEERLQELQSKLSTARLASFRESHQPEIGKVHDPMSSTISHLSPSHTFGIKAKKDLMGVCELVGNSLPKAVQIDKQRKHAAGLKTHHTDDLDQQKHIVPKLNEAEDKTLTRKITEDALGGTIHKKVIDRVFGLPSVREASGRTPRGARKLADSTNYGDELGAKGLMYPTPRNVYGAAQLAMFEEQLSKAKFARAAKV